MSDSLSGQVLEQLRSRSLAGRRVLLRGGTVVTMDRSESDLAIGDVLLEDSRIEAVGADLSEAAADGQAVVVDATGMIVMPGMHDTHRHCWQGQLRRLEPDLADLGRYLEVTHQSVALHYRPEDIYASTLVSALGALDGGVTCLLDFAHNLRSPEHADAAIQAMLDAGIRGVHASSAAFFGEWAEQWPGDLTRLQSTYFSSEDQLLTLRMGVLGTEQLGNWIALAPPQLAFARDLGIGITADGLMGEDSAELIEQLARDGQLGPDVTLIHCNGLSDRAWQAIAGNEVSVSLAITSDAQLGIGTGIPPIQHALDHGVRPGLSMDTEVALSADMFTQMRMALNTQRMHAHNRRIGGDEAAPDLIGARDALEFATVAGARVNGLSDKVGTVTPGMAADLVLLGAEDINTMPLNDAVGTIVSGADTKNIHAVFVAGEVRAWNGDLVGQDIDQVRRLVHDSRDYLLAQSGRPRRIVG